MLKLHGFSSSNYYNIAKLALLEKGAAFEEVHAYTGASATFHPEFLDKSPLGKVPCLQTDEGYLTESRVIVDYLERALPNPALYPAGAFAQAKVLELTQIIDLYLELPARRLLPNVFGRSKPPERIANEVLEVVKKGVSALQKLADFRGYLVGDRFSAADIAAVIHFPVVRMVTKSVLDSDPLAEVPGLLEYVKRIEERPAVQRVRADAKADFPDFLRHIQERAAAAAAAAQTPKA